MSRGRHVPNLNPTQADVDAAFAAFVVNEVAIHRAGPMRTPIGIIPALMCEPHADLVAVIAYQRHHPDLDVRFESSYCLSLDSSAWIALRAIFPLPIPRTLTWVLRLPERRALLQEATRAQMLMIGYPGARGALLLPDVMRLLGEPFSAYELAHDLVDTLRPARKAAQN